MTNSLFALIALNVVPVVLAAAVPRRWLVRSMLLWLASPAILYWAVILWEMFTRPSVDNPLYAASYGFMLVSSIVAIPWIAACGLGFGIGLGIRWLLRARSRQPSGAVAAVPVQGGRKRGPQPADECVAVAPAGAPAASDAQASADGVDWRYAHIGFDHDSLKIGGVELWKESWRPAGEPALQLPHPVYSDQIHGYERYLVGDAANAIRFAAAELSNSVWGFYVPAGYPVDVEAVAAGGSLLYRNRLAAGANASATLIDAASGQILVDGAGWASSRIIPKADGRLVLHVRGKNGDRMFWIDPATRTFHDRGEGGEERPLAELVAAVAQARSDAERKGSEPYHRMISPDGAIRVDLASTEWANSHWVHSPKVTEIAGGQELLDLWDFDWDASVSFPGVRRVRLDLRRYHVGGAMAVELDLARGTYRILSEFGREGPLAEGPLADVKEAVEAASQRAGAAAGLAYGQRPASGRAVAPKPFAAWRMALLILAGALVAVAAGTYFTLRNQSPEKQVLTPLPKMPGE